MFSRGPESGGGGFVERLGWFVVWLGLLLLLGWVAGCGVAEAGTLDCGKGSTLQIVNYESASGAWAVGPGGGAVWLPLHGQVVMPCHGVMDLGPNFIVQDAFSGWFQNPYSTQYQCLCTYGLSPDGWPKLVLTGLWGLAGILCGSGFMYVILHHAL